MMQEIFASSTTTAILLVLITIVIAAVIVLPMLYYAGWMDDEDEGNWVWNGSTWKEKEPEPKPIMYVFYSKGIKKIIDETLKPVDYPIEIDTKSIEINEGLSKNKQSK